MPATKGNRTSRSNTITATSAASIAIQNTIGRVKFMAYVVCGQGCAPVKAEFADARDPIIAGLAARLAIALLRDCVVELNHSDGGSNAQYARRNEPRDESCGDCRSRDRGNFVQCRIIIC